MLQIRCYEDSDHAEVVALHTLALDDVGVNIGPGFWDADLDNIADVYLNNSGEFLIGLWEGRLVAMGALQKISAERAEIKRMRVQPAFQGRGFGQTMLTELERRASTLGYTNLHLHTSIRQVAAQKLYLKNGYQEIRRKLLRELEIIFYEKNLIGKVEI
jgi:GNAT superfamily N-acetyltransferase